jgi:MYXO-CTERM domain-containing protein
MKHWIVGSFVLALGVPASALANGESAPEPRISNGTPVEQCGWPTVVAVSGGGGLCTGTLVAPDVVAYAAHCGASGKSVRFSQQTAGGKRIEPEFCMTNPGYSYQGNDWALCKLRDPVDLPVTPIVFGCEESILQPGAQIAIIGFGQNVDDQGAGTKRWGMTTLLNVNWAQNITNIGGNGQPSICPGDSGGPTMIQYPDGSWHSFGIASTYNGTCGSGGIHALLPGAVQWLEQNSGADVTPCHDVDGNWNPTPYCQGFFAGDETSYGTWSDWCEGTPASGSSDTCGDPFDAIPDDTPPQVVITAPPNLSEFDPGEAFDILIQAADEGYGVHHVSMKINGDLSPIDDATEPYEFLGAAFASAGTYELVAVAEDWAGNVTDSESVWIGIGGAPEIPDDSGEEGETDEGTGDGTDTGDDEDGMDTGETGPMLDDGGGSDDSGKGCGCSTGSVGSGALMLLVLAPLFRRRRKRAA